jgi:hypothetical protein
MPLYSETQATLRFTIRVQDPHLDESEVRRLLEEAVRDAEAAASRERAISAKAQVPGAFGGVGEMAIAVKLLLPYLHSLLPYLEHAGAALAEGVCTAAGELFFNQYLAPRLRKRNLLPGDLQVTGSSPMPKPASMPAAGQSLGSIVPGRKKGRRKAKRQKRG